MSAQENFFEALSSAIDATIEKPDERLVCADSVLNVYLDMRVSELLKEIRESLCTTNDFSCRYAPIDGLIRNHKILGTRAVEFDEFQHFTQQRKIALTISASHCVLPFHARCLSYCEDTDVLAEAYRTTRRVGFRRAVAGFRYDGVRMSQRAYFDTMKDYCHFSSKGQGFSTTLRFAIPDFDVLRESDFLRLDSTFIKNRIMLTVIPDFS